ncbi:hypothetical protein ACQVSO_27890, partial [Bacillus paranthracis]|uniref:hypothetical protein n=1 Tax=Bacillus paranthracis TaxID=2026186 RepID=UPI003D64BDBE
FIFSRHNKTAPPIVSYLSNKLGAVQSRVVFAFFTTYPIKNGIATEPTVMPTPFTIPLTNSNVRFANIIYHLLPIPNGRDEDHHAY